MAIEKMKHVKMLRKEGVEKTEIYRRAMEAGLDRIKVSKYLNGYPDVDLAAKYDKANKILIGAYLVKVLFGLCTAVGMLSEFSPVAMIGVLILALLLPGCIVYCVYKKMPAGYIILSFFMFRGVLSASVAYQDDLIGSLITVITSIALMAYTIVLKNKIFPYQVFFHNKKNAEGIFIYTKSLMS